VDGWIHHNCQFEVNTFWDAQPVKADERWDKCSDHRILKISRGIIIREHDCLYLEKNTGSTGSMDSKTEKLGDGGAVAIDGASLLR